MLWVSWDFTIFHAVEFHDLGIKTWLYGKNHKLEAEFAGYEAESPRKEAELPGHWFLGRLMFLKKGKEMEHEKN